MKLEFPDKLLPVFFARASQKKQPVETYIIDLLEQLGSKIKADQNFKPNIDHKMALSKWIILQALKQYGSDKVVIAWTGGKDSTLILEQIREVVKENKLKMPDCMFINEGHVFEEIVAFVKNIGKKWKLNVYEAHNSDVSKQAKKIGDLITVKKLDKLNQAEVKRLGYKKPTFPYEVESYIGNHLMKTVAMNRYLAKHHYQAVITGIRWDEQAARAQETYFSERGDQYTPNHMRIHPILHFQEAEIWEAILKFKIPFCQLYKEGYRSLGAKGTTKKAGDKPAWEQDFVKTTERAGRRQDKEGIMDNLRKLGYM